jgi:hypothetical protein
MQLISFDKYNSSESSPIGFFDNFFKKNLLAEAKSIFLSSFPNPNDENDNWNKFPVKVDALNERFSVEYQVEEFVDEFEPPKINTVVVEYFLESELKKLFKYQYEQSKQLLLKKFEELSNSSASYINPKKIKNLKEGIKDIHYKILGHLEHLNQEQYSEEILDHLKEPLRSLILFLYNRFASVLPDPTLNQTILSVVQSEKSILQKLDLSILSTDTADRLFNLTDRFGRKIIAFKNSGDDLERFRLFCQGKCGEINSPINIVDNFGAAFYTIGKIAKKIGIQRSTIEEYRLFSFKGVPFVAALCYTETTRFQHLNKQWADIIDETFKSCLV